MSIYFCQDCQQFKDDDYHPMTAREICPACDIEREDRQRKFIVSEVERHVQETERRSVKQ
jgi:hypothetical protein